MRYWVNALCPVTDEVAKRSETTYGDYEEYDCSVCKRFQISGTALETIKKYDKDEKIALLSAARKQAEIVGGLPFINHIE